MWKLLITFFWTGMLEILKLDRKLAFTGLKQNALSPASFLVLLTHIRKSRQIRQGLFRHRLCCTVEDKGRFLSSAECSKEIWLKCKDSSQKLKSEVQKFWKLTEYWILRASKNISWSYKWKIKDKRKVQVGVRLPIMRENVFDKMPISSLYNEECSK